MNGLGVLSGRLTVGNLEVRPDLLSETEDDGQDRTLNLKTSETQATIHSVVIVWVQDARWGEDRLPSTRRAKEKKEQNYYVVEKSHGPQKRVLEERMEGKHKLETRSSGKDGKWRQSNFTKKNNGPRESSQGPNWKI